MNDQQQGSGRWDKMLLAVYSAHGDVGVLEDLSPLL